MRVSKTGSPAAVNRSSLLVKGRARPQVVRDQRCCNIPQDNPSGKTGRRQFVVADAGQHVESPCVAVSDLDPRDSVLRKPCDRGAGLDGRTDAGAHRVHQDRQPVDLHDDAWLASNARERRVDDGAQAMRTAWQHKRNISEPGQSKP